METANPQSKPAKRNRVRYYTTPGDHIFMFFIYVMLWASLVLVALPILFIFASSFSSAEAIAAGRVMLWPVEFNTRGYEMILKTSTIVIGYRNSLMYAVLGTMLNLVMTLLAAYPLSRKDFQGRNVVMVLLSITMFFNGGLIPTYLLVRGLGLLDTVGAMVIPVAMGVYNVIITRTFIQSNIPTELYESASLEGCGDFHFLMRIVIPLSTPIIAVMALLYAVGHWNSYMNAILYLKNPQLLPLQLILRDILILNMGIGSPNDVNKQLEMQYFSYLVRYSTIIVASLPVMIIYPFVQKYFIKGIMIGALKG